MTRAGPPISTSTIVSGSSSQYLIESAEMYSRGKPAICRPARKSRSPRWTAISGLTGSTA